MNFLLKTKMELTHRNLCNIAAKYLRNKGIQPFHKCQYSVCELERVGECPDAFGWGGSSTQLIEVKVSRSDFLSDKKKFWRIFQERGLGRYRSYLCPEWVIKVEDLPDKWGLLYVSENGNVSEVKKAEPQESNMIEEINLLTSILRREGIRPQVFSYKKHKSDFIENELKNNGI